MRKSAQRTPINETDAGAKLFSTGKMSSSCSCRSDTEPFMLSRCTLPKKNCEEAHYRFEQRKFPESDTNSRNRAAAHPLAVLLHKLCEQ